MEPLASSGNSNAQHIGSATGAIASTTAAAAEADVTSALAAPQPHHRPTRDAAPPRAAKPKTHRAQPLCRYYGTASGCRAGEACAFVHDPARVSSAVVGAQQSDREEKDVRGSGHSAPKGRRDVSSVTQATQLQGRKYIPPPVEPSRVARRPVPRVEKDNPREFQLAQLRRRFSPKEDVDRNGSTSLIFGLIPSDPDFPFDIDALECELHVPSGYPGNGRPHLRVKNTQMDRGYQINIERGFDALVARSHTSTLLSFLNALDRQLETLLAAPKADTVKLIANAGIGFKEPSLMGKLPHKNAREPSNAEKKSIESKSNYTLPSYTPEQLEDAKSRREAETRQLEARLGRLPLFHKSQDGIEYTIPIQPRKREDLPVPLQAVKLIKLFVPLLYALEPCRIRILGVNEDSAKDVELAFAEEAKSNPQLSLVGQVNNLSQNMHRMATTPQVTGTEELTKDLNSLAVENPGAGSPALQARRLQADGSETNERAHVILISRPPEWDVRNDSESSEDLSEYDSEEESGPDEVEESKESLERGFSTTITAERTISISLPSLELYGIELLELSVLGISVKCDRCKSTLDVQNLKDNSKRDYSGIRSESCQKCANSLGIGLDAGRFDADGMADEATGYRMDLMHTNSVRAGFLDLDGCTVVDMLPSNFMPTCSECSTPYPNPGVVSVRGDSSMAICRECHRKMNFRFSEVKFLLVNSTTGSARQAPARRKVRERLGITIGQELPRRGRCSHYGKSYRWFRFSCCSKVFPCDKSVSTPHAQLLAMPSSHAGKRAIDDVGLGVMTAQASILMSTQTG